MESKLTFDQSYITPPAISIECPADETPESLGYSRLIQSSPVRSPSTEDTTPRGFSSLGSTVIPRLARFSIARICIARFFEAAKKNFHSTISYLFYTYKKYDNSAMQIF